MLLDDFSAASTGEGALAFCRLHLAARLAPVHLAAHLGTAKRKRASGTPLYPFSRELGELDAALDRTTLGAGGRR